MMSPGSSISGVIQEKLGGGLGFSIGLKAQTKL